MFCPKIGCHISQCQSGSVTAFEVWNVSPSPCLFFGGGEGGLYFCCTALWGRTSWAPAHKAAPPGSFPDSDPVYFRRSFFRRVHQKEEGKEQQSFKVSHCLWRKNGMLKVEGCWKKKGCLKASQSQSPSYGPSQLPHEIRPHSLLLQLPMSHKETRVPTRTQHSETLG